MNSSQLELLPPGVLDISLSRLTYGELARASFVSRTLRGLMGSESRSGVAVVAFQKPRETVGESVVIADPVFAKTVPGDAVDDSVFRQDHHVG